MAGPLVSFVLPSFNRREILLRVLRELTAVARECAGEIIVVDNASADGSPAAVKKHFPEVRLIRSEKNLGAAARNWGLKAARGGYVFMLDDDSRPLPGSVLPGVKLLQKDPGIGCVAYLVALPDGRRWTNGVYTVFTGCGALFPKRVLKEIGGYPDDILYYAEEYDVAFRLWDRGYRVVNVKELAVFHEKPPGNPDFEKRLGLLVANNALIYSRYLPAQWAAERIEFENWRYKAIAQKEGVMPGYAAGLQRAVALSAGWLGRGEGRLSAASARKALGLDQVRRRLRAFARRTGAKNALVLTAGKLLPELIRDMKAAGVAVSAVADENPFMAGHAVEGAPVIGCGDIGKRRFDCFVSGSFSLAVNDQLQRWAAGRPGREGRVPFFRACDYDKLG